MARQHNMYHLLSHHNIHHINQQVASTSNDKYDIIQRHTVTSAKGTADPVNDITPSIKQHAGIC